MFDQAMINMNKTASFLIICAGMLVGCTTGTSRDCPAFGSAMADQWSTAFNEGDAVVFVNQLGEELTLLLESRVDSEPFNTGGNVPSSVEEDDIKCIVSSARRYVFDNDEGALVILIEENISSDPTAVNDLFSVQLGPQVPVGEAILPVSYIFLLAETIRPELPSAFNLDNSQILATRTLNPIDVNGNADGFAVEQIYRDPAVVFDAFASEALDTNSPAAIVRVVLAEGGPNPFATSNSEAFIGGLIQFETVSGEIFTRQ